MRMERGREREKWAKGETLLGEKRQMVYAFVCASDDLLGEQIVPYIEKPDSLL